ncbi:MAG: PQQ-dependent dehydrogenase, methanol/ethanol family [Deltaproteobacteria bacterium]|jgi:PQQ-dependent dehydrogenase (methanol/ethanol family)|nr:PQQ-dependent dehydrogenase, methanol/ethanol family [Deltaproteobacteria bacterium]
MGLRFAPILAALIVAWGCGPSADAPPDAAGEREPRDVRLRQAASDGASWLMHGRTYDEQRFSPLDQIDEGNVAELGLVWSFDMKTRHGVESTPLVVDGVFYVTGPWSVVHALDARSGELLWEFDPKVPRSRARVVCCGVVNRGVAAYAGRVFVGTLDGRLIALDASTGRVEWETLTVDPAEPYAITGAPRVVAGRVVIGNAGAEYGVRGYVSAYDAETGALEWRTYTVPGDPAKGFESPALERAAATWSGDWWELGGGGTVWDAMAYDPDLDLLYVGTGNGTPHPHWIRSPEGGDNLYLSSILALRPGTGELVWYFQTTPRDSWDYTATQHMILADLEIEGRLRRVLMQAPKNGFFWVLDRETGEFLSAEPYVGVSWAKGVSEKGRPIVDESLDYRDAPQLVSPGSTGGHNWHPMSFHPDTGLVYIPAHEIPMVFRVDEEWVPRPGRLNTALDYSSYIEVDVDEAPRMDAFLLAWDPVAQREVWRVAHRVPYNGGVLSTGGNLVFQGSADGHFVAYRASDGEKLWEASAGTGVMAGPVTYRLDGVQYVSVAAGWGGSFALTAGEAALEAGVWGGGRVLTYALGGQAPAPPRAEPPRVSGSPPAPTQASRSVIERGRRLYDAHCMGCHGPRAVSGGSIRDLRDASAETHARFRQIVLEGEREPLGMPSFGDRLTTEELGEIQAYLRMRSRR